MSRHTVGPMGFRPTPLSKRRRILTRTHPTPVGPIGLVKQKALTGTGSLGEQVVTFAQSQIGKIYFYKNRTTGQKGRGECWDLAEGALNAANAKTSTDLNPTLTQNGDYIWGQEVSFKELQPGDIIQFNGHIMSYPDRDFTRGHHTAIVEKMGEKGAVVVIEQHVTKNKATRRSTLYFYDTIIEEKGQQIPIKVSGKFSFYRPMLKHTIEEYGF